jgi:hypothetical protein
MADVPYAECIAWLASRKAGLEYWLNVHDPVLRLASAALPPGHPVYAITVAAIINTGGRCRRGVGRNWPGDGTAELHAHTPPPPEHVVATSKRSFLIPRHPGRNQEFERIRLS